MRDLYSFHAFAGIGGTIEAEKRSNRADNLSNALFRELSDGLVRPTPPDDVKYRSVAEIDQDEYAAKILRKQFPNSLTLNSDIRNFYRFADEYPCYMDVHDEDWNCEDDCGELCEIKWCPDHEEQFSECDCIGHAQFDQYIVDRVLPADVATYQLDVLSGGFPCKQVSVSANALDNRYGLDGEDSGLWAEQARLLTRFDPPFGVIENTAGLKNDLGQILSDLDDIGYGAVSFYLTASRAGADHQRRRHFLLISNEHASGKNPDVLHDLANLLADEDYVDARTEKGFEGEYDGPLVAQRGELENMKQRLRAIGNAVAPDQAKPLYDAIRDTAAGVAGRMVRDTVVLEDPVAIRREDGSFENPDGEPIDPDSDLPGRCILKDGKVYTAEQLQHLSSAGETEWMTPVARDYKGGTSANWFDPQDPDANPPGLPDQIARKQGKDADDTRPPTHPDFAEYLMSFDDGFTRVDGVIPDDKTDEVRNYESLHTDQPADSEIISPSL